MRVKDNFFNMQVRIAVHFIFCTVFIVGCANQNKYQKSHKEIEKNSKGYNHSIHIKGGTACKSCHNKVYKYDDAGMPNEKLCVFCHKTVFGDQPVDEFYNKEKWLLEYQSITKYSKINMSHQQHLSNGVKCVDCHGDVANSVRLSSDNIPVKRTCFSCHAEWNTTEKCSICHKEPITFSHPAQWGAPKHNHCLECHIPISTSDKCSSCHNTASCVSSLAPLRPDDLPHRRGLMCRACHYDEKHHLKHVDNVIDCRTCHKL